MFSLTQKIINNVYNRDKNNTYVKYYSITIVYIIPRIYFNFDIAYISINTNYYQIDSIKFKALNRKIGHY